MAGLEAVLACTRYSQLGGSASQLTISPPANLPTGDTINPSTSSSPTLLELFNPGQHSESLLVSLRLEHIWK